MRNARRLLTILGNSPAFRLDLIRHDVPERDREWFAWCQIQHFGHFPWAGADAVRGFVALWLLLPASNLAMSVALLVLAAISAASFAMIRTLGRRIANAHLRLRQIRMFLLGRGLAWSVIASVLVLHAGPNLGVVTFFIASMSILDLLLMLAMPLTGLAAAGLLILGTGGSLLTVPGIDPAIATLVSVLALFGMHHALFNLNYLFATRRLRTHRLRLANETIQSLLRHYDEHGADALIEVDEEGRLRQPSAKLCELLGRPAAVLADQPLAAIFEPGRELEALVRTAHEQHRFRGLAVPLRVAGERRWWSISGAAVIDADGRERGFRGFAQDITEQRANEERIRIMAMRDNLTGLVNRAIFTDRLNQALATLGSAGRCGVLFLDLDSFKLVNDTYGHAAGDSVLIEAAWRIEHTLGPDMLAARLGGDEFAVLAWNVTDPAALTRLGETIVAELAKPVVREDVILPCGASVGIALGPEHGRSGQTLLRAADIALYEAKSRGRNTSVLFHPGLLRDLQERRELEMDLRMALERGQFEVWYQPLINIGSRQTTGYEALLRWHHPKRGIVLPSEFIPLAEELGIINPIGEWALRAALREAATWNEDLTIAVNVSPAQMRNDALLSQVVGALAGSGVAPARLELEITETLLMEQGEAHVRTLHRLRALGVRIVLDDFGTGYSSLNYLRRFPFDKLKVDRSFVCNIVDEPESRAIVDTVLSLAREFRMTTTAEGIESEAQLAELNAMGCSQAQGFLFDKPLPTNRIPDEHRLLKGRRLVRAATG